MADLNDSGTPQPVSQPSIQDRVAAARAAGASWDDINSRLSSQIQAARDAGATDAEIKQRLGYTDPAPLTSSLADTAKTSLAAAQPQEGQEQRPAGNAWESFKGALEGSSAGLLARGKLPEFTAPENEGIIQHLSGLVGSTIGELPMMTVGAIIGAAATAETGPGAIVGAGAGGLGLPALIRSTYVQALQKGQIQGPRDFIARAAQSYWDAAKGALEGASTAQMGISAGAKLAAAGAGPLAKFATQTAAQVATYVGTSSALEHQLPTVQGTLDAAVTIGALHVSGMAAEYIPTIKENLLNNWSKTGEDPQAAANRAAADPVFRAEMQAPAHPPEPADSSATQTPEGPFIVGKTNALTIQDEHEAEVQHIETEAYKAAAEKAAPEPGSSEEAWDTVAGRMAGPSPQPSFIENATDWAKTFYREFIRKDSPLEPIYEAAETGKALPPMDDPRTWMRLQELSPIRSKYMIENKMIDLAGNVVGPGLNEIIKPFANETGPKNFWTYAIGRWATEKATQEKETGVEIDAAHQVVKEGAAKYEDAFQKLVTFQNQSLKYLSDSGVISKKAYDTMTATNTARIPGYRVGKEAKGVSGGAGLRTFNSVKEFFGSKAQIKNVQESIMRDTFIRVELANRNQAKLNVMDAGERAGLAHRDINTRPVKFDLTDEEINKLGIDAANSEEDLTASIWRRIGKNLGPDQIPYFRDGKLMTDTFDDPAIYKFMNGLDTRAMSSVEKVMAQLTKVTRASIVLNPAFPIHIMEYDLPFQAILKGRFTPADFGSGAKTIIGRLLGNKDAEARYEAALRNGALAKVYNKLSGNAYIREVMKGQEDPAFHSGVWNAIKTPYDMLRGWAQSINDMQKVGRFQRGLASGEKPLEAGLRARGAAYHDPYVGGNLTTGNNRTIMFLGAYVNGMDQTLRGALGYGKTTTGDKLSATGFWTRGAAIITVPMLASWWAYKDKAWYKAMPEWQKSRGLPIPIGDPDNGGHVFFYPMPQLLSFVFGTVPLDLAKAAFEQDPHAFDNFGSDFAESFVPSSGAMLYSLATPVIEHITNHSFFRDRPLVSEDTKNGVLAPEQYSNYSSETAKFLAQKLNDWPLVKNFNLSPPVIDNYLQGWFGTMTAYATKAADLAIKSYNPDAPASSIEDWPGFNSFLERYPSASAQPIQDFMTRMDGYNAVHGSLVKTLEAGDMNRFAQIAKQNPAAAALHAWQLRGVNTVGITRQNAATAQALLGQYAQNADMASVQTILQMNEALKGLRAYTALIGAHETPEVQKQISVMYQEFNPGASPLKSQPFTPQDKKQLLDQAYGWMQMASERGNEAADKAGFK